MTLEKICQQEVEKVIGMAIIYNNFYVCQRLDVWQLAGCIKALVLPWDSDWCGDAFGDASAAFRQAAEAAAIEEQQ